MRLIARRLSLLVLGLALGSPLGAHSPASPSQPGPARVVFVCEHGSVKSLVRAMYFNRWAAQRGLPYRTVAWGVKPDSSVPAPVREGLSTDGFAVSGFEPQPLTASDVAHASLVISIDQDVTSLVGTTRYLNFAGYPQSRAGIAARVQALVDELARTPVQ